MGLQHNDLKDLVSTIVEIDSYKSKMGEDADIVTVTFSVLGEEPAKDLENLNIFQIEKMILSRLYMIVFIKFLVSLSIKGVKLKLFDEAKKEY